MATFPRRRAARYARSRSLPYPAALEVRVRSHHVNLDGEHASRSTMRTGALPYPAALDVRLGERQRRLGTEGSADHSAPAQRASRPSESVEIYVPRGLARLPRGR